MYHPPLAGGSRLSMMDTHMPAKSLQLCPTLHGPVDCSPPGSSLHGIPQARILEWLALLQGITLTQGSNLCLTSPELAGDSHL